MPASSGSPSRSALQRRRLASPSHVERVTAAIGEIAAIVPPVWPLEDYVAVNPFLGLAPARFLEARQMLRDVRDCELLLPASHFHDLYDRGEICTADLEQAFRQCLEAYPDLYTGGDPRRLVRLVAELAAAERSRGGPAASPTDRRYHTASELIDARLGSSWSSHVITDISRHCGLHFDRGQAAWPSPWKHLALYEAWRESARISRRMDMLGIKGFRQFVDGLPAQPDQAVATLLDELGVPERHWRPFLLTEIFSVAGWASYLRYRLWEATLADGATIDEHVIGLLAIRLAYDAALANLHPEIVAGPGGLFPAGAGANDRPSPSEGVLGRYLFQVATEISYRRRLCSQLAANVGAGFYPAQSARADGVESGFHGLETRGYGATDHGDSPKVGAGFYPARSARADGAESGFHGLETRGYGATDHGDSPEVGAGFHPARSARADGVDSGFHGLETRGDGAAAAARKTLQMIFCIDVRSEVFRRHLEACDPGVQTLGFAGFFGMPLEFVPLGAAHGPAQCPVLLRPGFKVAERIAGDSAATARAAAVRHRERLGRRIWKVFQNSATSCFSFVESLGLAYLPKLLTDSLGWTRPVLPAGSDGVPRRLRASVGPDAGSGPMALPLEQRIELAAGMLTNLGLLDGFARIVAICGHGSEMVNNPYRAGYDCGACGGHSGEPNARVAADLLNDPLVRAGLAARGIAIPSDTWFIAAVHVTTTDEIRFPDLLGLPATHAEELAAVKRWLAVAGEATRQERAERLGARVRAPSAAGRAAAAAAVAKTQAAVLRRSRDWSEVRPEWGLAGNAAFIVAPRWRTAGLDLGGRTFLHDYDHARDPEGRVLELIMTAPMVVTSWINLQYYASAVDNRSFGSGNKLIHNVTGQFGVLLGNGGDLMTGLPWQAVSDGRRLVHEPLRLAVVIEAPRPAVARVIEKHKPVADLVENGWLTLVVREGDAFFRRTADGRWQPEAAMEAQLRKQPGPQT